MYKTFSLGMHILLNSSQDSIMFLTIEISFNWEKLISKIYWIMTGFWLSSMCEEMFTNIYFLCLPLSNQWANITHLILCPSAPISLKHKLLKPIKSWFIFLKASLAMEGFFSNTMKEDPKILYYL